MANPYRGGTPDNWYSGIARDLWIEWKFIVVPARADTIVDLCAGKKPSLSALQAHWIERRRAEGRNVWIAVGSKDGGVILTGQTAFSAGWFRIALRTRKEMAATIANFVQRK